MNFDSMLYRPLRSGKEFEKLIPKTTCKSTNLGTGMTDFSIKKMVEWINQFKWQTAKIAKLLEKSSLDKTVNSIHDFCYWHFQYKADKSDQFLRSPACSWYDRQNGIDCKSYTIIASCILSNLGIKHYIRKIKQPGFAPADFTHVYVVVPKDQKTESLEKGHYVIDGTLKNNVEPTYIEKQDMSLAHYGLNGVQPGLGFSIGNVNLSNMIGSLSCWGGSSMDEAGLRKYLTNVENYYVGLFTKINQAVQQKNNTEFSALVNEFYGNTLMFLNASKKNRSKGWNTCTTKAIDKAIEAFTFYNSNVGTALTGWLNDNFNKGIQTGMISYTSDGAEAKYGFRHLNNSPAIVVQQPLLQYTQKNKDIVAFQITPYVLDSFKSTGTFNVAQFLSGLSTVISSVSPGTTTPGTTPQLPGGSYQITDPNTPQTSNAGFGWLGWVLVAAAGGYAFTQMKNKGEGSKTK